MACYTRRFAQAACLAITVAFAASSSAETVTPIRNAQRVDIGKLDKWRKRPWRGLKVFEPTGWLGFNNGALGVSLFKRVKRGRGFAVKGTVKGASAHGERSDFSPRLEAGSKFDPRRPLETLGNGIPVATRHANLRGEYKFHAKAGSGFSVFVSMERDGKEIGQGSLLTKAEVTGWTTFNLPIQYFNAEVPDRCFIRFDILGKQTGDRFQPAVQGTYYVIDNLTFADPDPT